MKIKMFIPIALVLCLAFSLCACGTITNTKETTAPITNTEATTAPAETKEATAPAAEFTEEDAIELVKSTYTFDETDFLHANGTVEVDGTNYYAVDLRRNLEYNTTYLATYFVTTDGSEIVEGYFVGGEPVLSQKEVADFTEEDALELVENTYELADNCFYHVRGTVDVDDETYYAVDVMKSLETNVTYMATTYFVKADGSDILMGYFVGEDIIFTTGDEKPDFEITAENAVTYVKAAYDFGDNEFLMLRGIEEIDGVNYYAVDLRRSFDDHSSYLSTFFVNEDGTEIIKGYYNAGTPVFSE